MKQYVIVTGLGQYPTVAMAALENSVSSYLEGGWELHGGHSVTTAGLTYYYSQVMVRDVPDAS